MTDTLTIRTNNVPRDILRWHDLTPKERSEFDYLDTETKQDDASFVRYKGWVYDLGEYMRCTPPIAPHPQRPGWETWDGYASDSMCSGTLVRYVDDFERVIMGTYCS